VNTLILFHASGRSERDLPIQQARVSASPLSNMFPGFGFATTFLAPKSLLRAFKSLLNNKN
jgi:hypothetical protein